MAWDVGLLRLGDDAELELVAAAPGWENHPSLSPDGRYLAFASRESGSTEIYVLDLEDRSRILVSAEGGMLPVWTRDGSQILYLVRGREIFRVRVSTEGGFSASAPERVPLPEGTYDLTFDVTADGSRFLRVRRVEDGDEPGEPPRLLVVRNWFTELRERLPR